MADDLVTRPISGIRFLPSHLVAATASSEVSVHVVIQSKLLGADDADSPEAAAPGIATDGSEFDSLVAIAAARDD